jgi:subtilisin family serine protease
MTPARGRAISLAATLALVASLLPSLAMGQGANSAAPTVQPAQAMTAQEKLRGDLAGMVAGDLAQDPRIAELLPGYREGELAYFVLLNQPPSGAQRTALEVLGVRILRSYSSIDAFAVASQPATVLRVAALGDVDFLAPIEVVVALDGPEPFADQTRSTAGDLGAPSLWHEGVTGKGVRIAILDTGIDPTHPDLDDQDFRRWSSVLAAGKVVDQRNFVGGGCVPLAGVQDGHGHGTHVASIAAGTGEGLPADATDNGRHAGVAPDAELAVAKVLTDAGAGLNSDLIAAMEWAATPSDEAVLGCGVGAQIVNLSLGSEARPTRLNSGNDIDLVSLALNRLAVRYGTLFVVAAGNSGPFIGSQLESPGSASQALSVAATAKDYDLNHDDTASGDPCAGYEHPSDPPTFADNTCDQGSGTQSASLSSLSSRGPSGDLWLRPDVAAPGYYIVSAQSATGSAIASQDINPNTRADPLYATASGTSMATPATAGGAALVLQAYWDEYGTDPAGASGMPGLPSAPSYALLRAALMNTALPDLREARLVSKTDLSALDCSAPLDQVPFACLFLDAFSAAGVATVYEVRNGPDDPFVGPLGEGAGKIRPASAIAALRDGVVVYTAASGSGSDAGTGPRDLQGTWQVGAVSGGASVTQTFVAHAAPNAGYQSLSIELVPGSPSDSSLPIPTSGPGAWTVSLPASVAVPSGGDVTFTGSISIPAGATPGTYTGRLAITTSAGQQLQVPVFAVVALHDPDPVAGNAPGAQATVELGDVFAKADTVWPSALGATGTGASSDWNVYPVELGDDLTRVTFEVADTDAGADTYDLYLYDARLDLVATTHPGAMTGVTDAAADAERGPTPPEAPQALKVSTPAAGLHYLVVNRAKVGRSGPQPAGDFGAFRLTVDEVRETVTPAPTLVSYEGDYVFTAGGTGRLGARLTDDALAPVAGRRISFTVNGSGTGLCGSGTCEATTDYRGIAQLATDAVTLPPGIHELMVTFDGDGHWKPANGGALILVVGTAPPPAGTDVHLTGGGWFLPGGAPDQGPDQRVHLAVNADGGGLLPPAGHFGYRHPAASLDLELVSYTSMTRDGDRVTLSGTVRHADGSISPFRLTVSDGGSPGRGHDRVRLELLDSGYMAEGLLGGGNVAVHD